MILMIALGPLRTINYSAQIKITIIAGARAGSKRNKLMSNFLNQTTQFLSDVSAMMQMMSMSAHDRKIETKASTNKPLLASVVITSERSAK